jgi:hypothetical protein
MSYVDVNQGSAARIGDSCLHAARLAGVVIIAFFGTAISCYGEVRIR